MKYEQYHIGLDTTLEALITSPMSLLGGFYRNASQLLDFEDENHKTNRERILEQYTKEDLENEASRIDSGELSLIRAGTILIVPEGAIDVEQQAMIGRNLFVKDVGSFSAFYSHYLDLLKRDDFTPVYRTTTKRNDVEIRQYDISIWIWSRAASRNGVTLIDVSRYVERCEITNTGTQNSFSLSLQAAETDNLSTGEELIARVNLDQRGNRWSAWDYINPETSTPEQLPLPWLSRMLQYNDIVFIRFERLNLEQDTDRIINDASDIVTASHIPGKVYDMIGLIDTVSTRFRPTVPDLTVEVTGRDLTKLLIEDGSYFFPLLFTENADTLFFNPQDTNKLFRRTFIKGTFDYLILYKMQSIRNSLGFLVNQLANLGVCNDALFSNYDDKEEGTFQNGAGLGGRRTRALRLTGVNDQQQRAVWEVVSGVWQIVDVLVDEQIDDRRVASSHISNPNSNLLSLVDSFCQMPFVEFFGDTYGDKYVFIARTPPYTRQAILSVLDKGWYVDVNLRYIENMDLQWDDTFYTWFEIDPRNMFLGRSDSIALAYVPVVYFPEMAEAFGNKQFKVVDNYISNRALMGEGLSENRDEFKQKVIEDFLYVIESYCYLPFTEKGTITIRRDRRIKAKTWIKIGDRFFYVDAVTNTFSASGEQVDGYTTLQVSRGMYIEYIRGKRVDSLNREINYWSPVKLDVIRHVLIQKLRVYESEEASQEGSEVTARILKNAVKASFGTDRDAFDFFLQRRQLYE